MKREREFWGERDFALMFSFLLCTMFVSWMVACDGMLFVSLDVSCIFKK